MSKREISRLIDEILFNSVGTKNKNLILSSIFNLMILIFLLKLMVSS